MSCGDETDEWRLFGSWKFGGQKKSLVGKNDGGGLERRQMLFGGELL